MKIIFTLLRHQWLSFWRSRGSGKNVVVQLFLGLVILYLLGCAILVGIVMPEIINELYPKQNAISVFCGFILYYFFIDIVLRFLMQELPILSIESYLTKNIRKKYLLRFLNLRSLFHFLNIVPLLLFLPFPFMKIAKIYSTGAAICFDLALIFLVLSNHFLAMYIKRKSIANNKWIFGLLAFIVAIGILDYKNIISINNASGWLFGKIIQNIWFCLIPAISAGLFYYINNRYLYNNLYLEEITKKQKRINSATEYGWLNKYGAVGDLISLEIKLITRNKRPRNVFSLSVIFLAYGFLFYKPELLHKGDWGFLLMGSFIITGCILINYGGFLFSWQSSYFDFILTEKIHIRNYIKSKLNFLILISTISFIISNLYGFIDVRLLILQLCAYLFNIGVNALLIVYIATFNYKYIDISQKAAFNYSGTGIVQWLYPLFICVIPTLIYLLFSVIFNSWAGIAALGIAGGVSLLFYNYWIDLLTINFNKRKHLIAEGFREK